MQSSTNLTGTRARARIAAVVLLALFAGACGASTTTLTEDSVSANTAPTTNNAAEEPDVEEPVADDPVTAPEPTTEEPEPAAAEPTPKPVEELEEPIEGAPAESDPDAPLGAGEASVELLDAGAEPRRELRFDIAGTCGEITELTQVQELSQVADGLPFPPTGPVGTVTIMETSVSPSGDNYDVRAVVTEAFAAPGTSAAIASDLDASLSTIVGLTSFVTITDRGIQVPGSSRVEGAGALGEMEALLEGLNQTQNPLPLEAVGVGAQWVTRSVVDIQGLLVETITTFELVAIDDTLVTVNVSGTQDVGENASMNMQGITAEITEWDITSSGTVTMDLATISPISATASSSGTQGFIIQGTELVQEISTDITTSTEPSTGCTGRTTRP